jgi:beta-ribofuranosylaminobenzene 5'-phosphate synthase
MHPTVKACMNFMLEKGAYGAGQSSFGPVTYGLVEGEEEAKELSAETKEFLNKFEGGTVFYSEVNNSGVEVKLDDRNYKRKNRA